MSETTVYGASDDLIEIEGPIREEFGATIGVDEEGDLLAFSSGVVLRIRYDSDGVWRILALSGESRVTIRHAPAGDEDDYSDRATLHDPIAWVVHGNEAAWA